MKINQIRLSRLRNDTHFQFHAEFKDLTAQVGKVSKKKGGGKSSEAE